MAANKYMRKGEVGGQRSDPVLWDQTGSKPEWQQLNSGYAQEKAGTGEN